MKYDITFANGQWHVFIDSVYRGSFPTEDEARRLVARQVF